MIPRTDLEKGLVGIWKNMLKADRVGAEDNFFDLGGHSLLLAELQTAIRLELGREVSLTDLFKYPNIRTLSGFLDLGERNAESSASQAGPRASRQIEAQKRRKQIHSHPRSK